MSNWLYDNMKAGVELPLTGFGGVFTVFHDSSFALSDKNPYFGMLNILLLCGGEC